MANLAESSSLAPREMDIVEQLLNKFETFLKSERASQSTLNNYIPIAAKFLKTVKDPLKLEEWDARDYLAHLYDVKKNTAYVAYYALSSFYRSQKIPFEIPVPEADAEPFRPTMEQGDVVKMITAIKEAGVSNEKGILALSTTYGLRRIEIMRASINDINHENRTITIHTAKKGRVAVQLIPDEVFNHIVGFDFKPRSDTAFADIFWRMVDKAGLELPRRSGFHSIRRALYTGLSAAGIDYFIRHSFMRWRMRGLELDAVYDQSKIDQAVFKSHPFLKHWKN